MKNRLSPKILFLSVLSLYAAPGAWGAQNVNVDQAINESISNLLPSGSRWEVKLPGFVKEYSREAKEIEVAFPAGFHKSHLTAQVWIQSEKGNNLFAVPVYIKSYGNDKSAARFSQN